MKNKKNLLFTLLSLVTMLASCALAPQSANEKSVEMMMDEMPRAAEGALMEAASAPYEEEMSSDEESMDSIGTDTERIVIKNANLSIVVIDPLAAVDTISNLAASSGGFVVSSNTYKTTTSQGTEVPVANITIRVPAEQLEKSLEEIKSLVSDPDIDVLNEEISGQDVTGEVTDLESRLRNLQAAEEQLLEIMDTAKKAEDVIVVFRELTSVREEIEVIQGQIKYYRESASLSAIRINIQAKEAFEPITIGGWQPGLQAQKALQALVEGGKLLVNLLIWLVIFAIPILAVIFLPIYLIIRYIRKKRKRKQQPSEKKVAK